MDFNIRSKQAFIYISISPVHLAWAGTGMSRPLLLKKQINQNINYFIRGKNSRWHARHMIGL